MNKPFEQLRTVPEAPQLPAGYPTMVLLALLPPLWFAVMDPRVPARA
jgi:alkane 1-monooxygenase